MEIPAENAVALVMLMIAFGIFLKAMRRKLGLVGGKVRASLLDLTLMLWDADNALTVRDFLNGGVSIVGAPGSGKSSGSAANIRDALLSLKYRGMQRSILVLAAKPEDVGDWRDACKRAGCLKDFRVFGPEAEYGLKLNPLEYLMWHGATPKEAAGLFKAVSETQHSGNAKGRESGDFWEDQALRLFEHTMTVLWLAYGRITMPEMLEFISGRAVSPEMRASAQWRESFHYQTLSAAARAEKTEGEAHDYKISETYFLVELPHLKGVVAYAYRHSYASAALENGVGIAQVAELLGHVDTRMVSKHYGHLGQKIAHMRDAARKATER